MASDAHGRYGASVLPVPADEEVALLLQTVWNLLADGDHWPSYRTVDRQLWTHHQVDIEAVIARTSEELLLGGRWQGGAAPHPEFQLSLTVAGAAACAGSDVAQDVFLRAVGLAAEAESHQVPEGDEPSVSFDQAVADVALDSANQPAVARQSGLLLHAEPWAGHLLLHEGGWRLTVDRRVRPYAAVGDLDAYWAVRVRQLEAGATSAATREPTQVPSPGGGVINLSRRWTIGPQLGAGGFGKVYRATGEDGSLAAAKFVPKTPGADREMLFVRLENVRNVVPVIDSGEVGDAWVLVMPLAAQSLQDRLQGAGGPLPVAEALAVLRSVAAALADLTGNQIVHRDIKPANVLLLDGAWCLADFGISRYAEASTAPDTHKYAMSPPYCAPERWRAERATVAADVYAVGVMAHELLSGVRPFPGPSREDYRDQHLHADPPRLQGAPPRLMALIEECLYKSAEARPAPQNLGARLERADEHGLSPGASRLAAANQQQAELLAKQNLSESRAQSEHERRVALATAARTSLQEISDALLRVITDEAPTATVQHRADGGWTAQLGPARIGVSAATPFDGRGWGRSQPPAFDVAAFATVSVTIPADRGGYQGRSHSLYFADAKHPRVYAWHETAFMISPLINQQTPQAPFALNPDESAAQAIAPVIAEYQVAWPFTELVVGELDEFVDRWVGWFAAAVGGQLTHPNSMPERPAEGTWRSS